MAAVHGNMPKYQIINESVRPITKADHKERASIKGLAREIIDRHPTSNPVVDEVEFTRLRAFFSPGKTCSLLSKKHCLSDSFETESFAEGDSRAITLNADPVDSTDYGGSLAKFIISRHGTDDQVLCDSEVETLKTFFPQGERLSLNAIASGEVC